jgi:hypothetical protein
MDEKNMTKIPDTYRDISSFKKVKGKGKVVPVF